MTHTERPMPPPVPFGGAEVTPRWIHPHLIGAYARHSGHADLLREGTDGSTGA
ncbi:DUF664 domain-containing protein [Streptomyces sp. RKAG290]|uniref:mycothiol transferase n=1 Tax=Streptomyces sp. RKAG290 TaxID=2888348 RepID=UPI0035A81CD1